MLWVWECVRSGLRKTIAIVLWFAWRLAGPNARVTDTGTWSELILGQSSACVSTFRGGRVEKTWSIHESRDASPEGCRLVARELPSLGLTNNSNARLGIKKLRLMTWFITGMGLTSDWSASLIDWWAPYRFGAGAASSLIWSWVLKQRICLFLHSK